MVAETQASNPSPERLLQQKQLSRLLLHPLFSQSKRYPAFLQYVVEQTIAGKSNVLKERNIGVEIFGRDPNYELLTDPVVRVTAAEVRKRLAQYYYDPAHRGELQISLPVGSYVPIFRQDVVDAPALGKTETSETTLLYAAERPVVSRSWAGLTRGGVGVALALVLIAGGLSGYLLRSVHPATSTERFWAPVLASQRKITLCIGAPKETPGFAEQIDSVRSSSQVLRGQSADTESISDHYRTTGLLEASDVVALSRITSAFALKPYRMMDAPETDYSRLQEGPTILVGAVDNVWTMRLTQALRYRFAWDSHTKVAQIVDTQNGSSNPWQLSTNGAYKDLARDYALVARYRDASTGQFVVIVGGLGAEGTEAASEVVSNPVYTTLLLAAAPKNWQSMNLEAVISTEVIHGEPGPPNVVATIFW